MARAVTFALLLSIAVAVAPAAAEPSDPPGVLLSRQVMEAQGLAVGDIVRLSADPQGREPRSFRIAGRYEPMPDPFRLTAPRFEARLHLPDLLALPRDPADPAAAESVGRINVALKVPADVAGFAREVSGTLPGLVAVPLGGDDEGSPFVVLRRFHTAIAVVTVLASTAFLLALMVIRAGERREIAGILRLLGWSRSRVLAGVLVEGLCVAVTGAVVGVVLALVAQALFNRFFQWHYDTALVFVRVGPRIMLRCIALAVPLGVGAGIVASWGLLRGEIMALLRR